MGIPGTNPGSLLLILIIVVLLFGTSRLRNLGKDLGEMVKSFRAGLNDTEKTSEVTQPIEKNTEQNRSESNQNKSP